MGGPSFSEVVVIDYIINSEITSPEDNKVSQVRHREIPATLKIKIDHWYRRIIFRERYLLPPSQQTIKFTKWEVGLGDTRSFDFGEIVFDALCVMLGAEKCYWVYYKTDQNSRQEVGIGEMKVPYCNCCIKDQYLNILNAVHEMAMTNFKQTEW